MTSMQQIRSMLHGNDQAAEFTVSLKTTRANWDDSERTKLLKEALRESVKLCELAKKDMPPMKARTAVHAVMQTNRMARMLEQKRLAAGARLLQDPLHGLEALTRDDDAADEALDLAGADEEVADHVFGCGERIDVLCERLRSMRPPTPSQLDRACDKGARPDVRDAAQPPKQAVDMGDAQVDKLTLQYIANNVKFQPLEDLEGNLRKVKDYQGLRRCFPQRFKHHSNLALLSNYTFKDDKEFQKCVWKPAPPWLEFDEQARIAATRSTTKSRSRSTVRPPAQVRFERDGSEGAALPRSNAPSADRPLLRGGSCPNLRAGLK